jgi:hypothetical protein
MTTDWQELTRITGGEPVIVERVRIVGRDVSIEGSFELPPLARLTADDQIFAAAFLRSHGSIKKMEETFGVSYPTIKNRLNRISEQLEFVKIESIPERSAVLERLEHGEITADEAVELLKGQKE